MRYFVWCDTVEYHRESFSILVVLIDYLYLMRD